ncbi:hypothetical protein [Kordia sp.]|uniref:hypothetical protein n=1 Tax=Kordia sp. TaxID=1965332 RepID=UPI003D6B9FBE
MIEILNNHCNKENGLLLFNPPTGSGKTHSVLTWIFENYKKYCKENRKIFFVTNLKKNLPYEELRDNFFIPQKKLYDFEKDITFLDSNSDCLINRFKDIEESINDYFKNFKVFYSIKSNVTEINNHKENPKLKTYVKKLKDELRTDFEPKFRRIIEKYLKENFKNKQERIRAIQNNDELKWMGELYPAVFTSKRKVFFLSVNKFYVKNSTLIEPSYSFLENDITKDAIIFIDEFDATKSNILKIIIDNGKNQRIDFIHLFTEIYWALSKNILPQKFITHSEKRQELLDNEYGLPLTDIQKTLLDKSEEIVQKYQLNYSFKTTNTEQENINQRNLLFHDFQYHSVYRNDKKFIRLNQNDLSKTNEIIFENTKPKGESMVHLLNDIKGFVNYFSGRIKSIAENYQQLENDDKENNTKKSEFTFDSALSTVIEEFALDSKYKNFIINNILSAREKPKKNKKGKPELNYDLSVYENGFRYYDFVDDDSHQSKTKTFIYSFQNTPEKFLLKLAEKSKVIGISATAYMKTVTGNYDINYFKRQLGTRFIELTKDENKKLFDLFEKQNKYYSKINIHTEWLDFIDKQNDFELLFGNKELADDILGKLNALKTTDYEFNRYLKISHSFKQFLLKEDIRGFLCLLNKEPKWNDRALNLKILEEIFSNLILETNQKDHFIIYGNEEFNVKNSYTVVNSNDFENKKSAFIEKLEQGKKIFIISMYQTMGAGQNIQFISPNPKKMIDVRSDELTNWNTENKTDINAIYLDKPTHIFQQINKNLNEEGFIKYLFQLEFLAQIGVISIYQLNAEVSRAFKNLLASFNTKESLGNPKVDLYKGENIKQHYAKFIIQAIGRICRTNLKSQNIYIYADKKIDEYICDFDVENNLVLNEFKALVKSSKQLIQNKKEKNAKFKNLATTTNRKVHFIIQKFISNKDWGWTLKRLYEWENLREMCLRFPTVSEDQINKHNLNRILDLYIELPHISNNYHFNIKETEFYNDYKNISVDFNTNKGSKVSSESARLNELLEIDGVRDFFKEKKWATEFKINQYIITPVMFNNIYKGALGEQIGKFIFERHFGIHLEELEVEYYENFDYKIKETDIYIDFKHWKESTEINFDEQESKIRKKLEKVKGERVFIINILSSSEKRIIKSIDEKIIEVPFLWNTETKELNHSILKDINAYATL